MLLLVLTVVLTKFIWPGSLYLNVAAENPQKNYLYLFYGESFVARQNRTLLCDFSLSFLVSFTCFIFSYSAYIDRGRLVLKIPYLIRMNKKKDKEIGNMQNFIFSKFFKQYSG